MMGLVVGGMGMLDFGRDVLLLLLSLEERLVYEEGNMPGGGGWINVYGGRRLDCGVMTNTRTLRMLLETPHVFKNDVLCNGSAWGTVGPRLYMSPCTKL